MIKKVTLTLASLLLTLTVMAEGYQLNSHSTRQMGMGHVGTALKLGAESIVFNPAGLATMDSKLDLSFGVTAISSKVTYKNGSYNAESDNPIGTPIFGYIGAKVSNRLYAGVSITNPAGNSLSWPDNWRGSHFVQNISLQAFSIQPTLSFKIADNFSIGAGLMINLGSFELNKGLLPIGALTPYLQVPGFPEPLADIINSTKELSTLNANLSGSSTISYGFNVGALYQPTEKWSIGLSYRSKVMMSLDEGKTALSYGAPQLGTLFTALTSDPTSPLFNEGIAGALMIDNMGFSASLPIPATLQFALAYYPCSKWVISAEAQYVGWSAYDKLEMKFTDSRFNTVQVKNFKNSLTYRLGGEYTINRSVMVRGGVVYDTTPVDKTLYSPETPGANKFSVTGGASFSLIRGLAVDIALQYLDGATTKGSAPDQPTPFVGEYKSTAIISSIGLRYSF